MEVGLSANLFHSQLGHCQLSKVLLQLLISYFIIFFMLGEDYFEFIRKCSKGVTSMIFWRLKYM